MSVLDTVSGRVITQRPLLSLPQPVLGLILISCPVILFPPTLSHFLKCFLRSKFSLLLKEGTKSNNTCFAGQHILTQIQVLGLTLTLLHRPGQAASPSAILDFHQELGAQR